MMVADLVWWWPWLGVLRGLLREIRGLLCRRRASLWLPTADSDETHGFKTFIVAEESG